MSHIRPIGSSTDEGEAPTGQNRSMARSPPLGADPAQVSSEWILGAHGRPAFVFAHQDDETVCAGLIHRIIGDDARGRFIWWTNGDGLAPEAGVSPGAYARIRIAEATESVRRLGASAKRKVDLESSEIENYRRLTELARGGAASDRALEYFEAEAARVDRALRDADPDRVFVLAWQGGHPEHDLVHLMTVKTVRALRKETGRPIPIIQVPAYEYMIACPLRFKPWFKGDVRSVLLDEDERAMKQRVFEAYPSQAGLFDKFNKLISAFGAMSAIRGQPFSIESYVGKEQFGVVDPDLDYRKSTHRWEPLNYMGDDFEGIPIRFDRMIRPLAEAILE